MKKFTKKELKGFSQNQLIEIILKFQDGMEQLKISIAKSQKDSSNSSKPPSTDVNKKRIFSLREKSENPVGGQKGHKGKTKRQVDNPDEIVQHLPNLICQECGQKLSSNDQYIAEKRQDFDIPKPTVIVTEHQKIGIKCKCGNCNYGKFPDDIKSSVQIGKNIKSFMVYLNIYQSIPYKRLSKLSKDILGFDISQRSIEKILTLAAKKGGSIYENLKEKIKNMSWLGSDETWINVNGKKMYKWVWQNSAGVFYIIGDRSFKMIKIFFGGKEIYSGTMISDCYAAQLKTKTKNGKQICLVHIHRDLKFLIDSQNFYWAKRLKKLLKKAVRAREKIWQPETSQAKREQIISFFESKLDKLLSNLPSHASKDAKNLQKRLLKYKNSVFKFMHYPDLPFHNNSSEQAIRIAKIKQKISGGFRTKKGAQNYSILLSIIESAKRENVQILDAINQLMSNKLVLA